MSKDLNVAMLPLRIEWNKKEANLALLEETIATVHPLTDLLILPETFSTGFPVGMEKDEVRELAERNTGSTIELLKRLAGKYKMAICGSFIADTGGSLYNRLFFIEPSGEEYFSDKRHLFTMAGEDKIFSRGYKRMSVRYRGWNISMVACYDIRFPAWCRNRNNEYDLLIAVANWPKVRINAWETLLKARAIENEAYVCGVNCSGIDAKDFEYDGSSDAIDFKGKSIAVKIEGTSILYATLSRERLDKFRDKFPAWRDADDYKLLDI
ncbi:MAG: nitrilase family protein [Muribaculaceae bacterium]|nr:nitrilase family protein [Muribaculaceae bacterium]